MFLQLAALFLGAQTIRESRVLHGDFVIIGNTLALECQNGTRGATEPTPWLNPASPTCAGVPFADGEAWSSADRMWHVDTSVEPPAMSNFVPGTGLNAPSTASSIASLNLPAAAKVVYARLYWVGSKAPSTACAGTCSFSPPSPIADATATLDTPVALASALSADTTRFIEANDYYAGWTYQSSADVTALVQAGGNGRYRLSGVDVLNFEPGYDNTFSHAAWWISIIYELASEPQRQVAIADGLDPIRGGSTGTGESQTLTVNGFRAPNAVNGKLAVVTVEGDANTEIGNDQLEFSTNGGASFTTLSDGMPSGSTNFFNSSFTYLGSPISNASVPTWWRNTGSFPQASGGRGSMAGWDVDVVAVALTPAASDITFRASTSSSSSDYFTLESFVASVETIAPELGHSQKSVTVVGGGQPVPGATLAYTIDVVNDGSDGGVEVVLDDALPPNVCFVPGSLEIVAGASAGPKSDTAGDDQAEFFGAIESPCVAGSGGLVHFRLGAGATAAAGGALAIGQHVLVRFEVVIAASASGTLSNQASLQAKGTSGAALQHFLTDADLTTPLVADTTDITVVIPVVTPPVVPPPPPAPAPSAPAPVLSPTPELPVATPVSPVAPAPQESPKERELALRGGVWRCGSSGASEGLAWLVVLAIFVRRRR